MNPATPEPSSPNTSDDAELDGTASEDPAVPRSIGRLLDVLEIVLSKQRHAVDQRAPARREAWIDAEHATVVAESAEACHQSAPDAASGCHVHTV